MFFFSLFKSEKSEESKNDKDEDMEDADKEKKGRTRCIGKFLQIFPIFLNP